MNGRLPLSIQNFEALSGETRSCVMESWAFIKEHKKAGLLPIMAVGLLLSCWAVWGEWVVEPYPLGQK